MTIAIATEGLVSGAVTDSSSPAVITVSPTPNATPGTAGAFSAVYSIAKATPIIVDITDTDGQADIAYVHVMALFLDGSVESVYHLNQFDGEYVLTSSQTGITNGRELSILPSDGWPGANNQSNLAVGLVIDAIDKGGNVTSTTLYWQLPPAGPLAAGGSVATPAPALGAIDHVAAALARLPEQFKAKG